MNMSKKTCVLTAFLSLSLLAAHANACMDHFSFDQGSAGLFGFSNGFNNGAHTGFGAKPLPIKEKTFRVKHQSVAVVVIDEDSNLVIDYDLPPEAKNVSLQFTATDNVELLDENIELTGLNGTVNARFRVKQESVVDRVTVTVSGEHEGEVLSYTSQLYINAKPATS